MRAQTVTRGETGRELGRRARRRDRRGPLGESHQGREDRVPAVVVRLRSSHQSAAPSFANLAIEGHSPDQRALINARMRGGPPWEADRKHPLDPSLTGLTEMRHRSVEWLLSVLIAWPRLRRPTACP